MTGFRDVDVLLATPRAMAGAAIFLVASAAWLLLCARLRWSRWFFVPFVATAGFAALFWATNARMDWDEVEHLHAAWLVAQGDVPYRDFWQHHPPLLWVVLAPLVDAVPASDAVVLVSRVVAALVLALVGFLGWRLARTVWGSDVRFLPFLVVFLATAVTWQFGWLRPDSLALPLLLVGVLTTLRAGPTDRLRWWLAGAALGLGLAFTYKNAALAVLPLVAAWTSSRTARAVRVALVVAGLAGGLAPLVAYLLATGAAGGFVEWVVVFNARIVRSAWDIDAGVVVVLAVGILRLRPHLESSHRRTALLFLLAIVAALPGALAALQHVSRHHLSLLLSLVAAVAAGLPFEKLMASTRRGTVAMRATSLCVLALLVLPAVRDAWNARGSFGRDTRRMRDLLRVSDGATVLIPGPEHPIVRRDAARLYTVWQVRHAALPGAAGAWTDGTGRTFVQMVRDERPAVVAADVDGLPIAAALERARILDHVGRARLEAFLRDEYVPREFAGTWLLVSRGRARGD